MDSDLSIVDSNPLCNTVTIQNGPMDVKNLFALTCVIIDKCYKQEPSESQWSLDALYLLDYPMLVRHLESGSLLRQAIS